MPTIIDTHTHLSQTREMLDRRPEAARVLRRQRGAEPRPGHDGRVVPDPRGDRGREDPWRGALLHRGPRHHGSGAGTHDGAALGDDGRRGARRRCDEEAAKKVDIIKIWVDDRMGTVKKLTPEIYARGHRRSAQEGPADDLAHLHARGCEGHAARRSRRVRARRARQGPGRRVHGAREAASEPRPRSEHAGSRRADGPQLAAREHSGGGLRRSSKPRTRTTRRRTRSGPSRRATSRR